MINGSEFENVTLSKFIFAQENQHWNATGQLTELLNEMQTIAKSISAILRKGGLLDPIGLISKKKNVKTIRAFANDIFINILSNTRSVGIMISSETRNVIEVDSSNKGKYIVAFDPLGGSRNVDVVITSGSTFVILLKADDTIPCVKDALNSTNKIVAAGYFIYGSATLLVYTTGEKVNEFVLDPLLGEFILIEENIKIKKKGDIISVNEGHSKLWVSDIKGYINNKQSDTKETYSSRYVGTLVADVHRTLKYGGIFMYPGTKNEPNGKLRILCECLPVAYVITVAGGLASNGSVPLMEIKPNHIHEKSPLFLGSTNDVEEFLAYISK